MSNGQGFDELANEDYEQEMKDSIRRGETDE